MGNRAFVIFEDPYQPPPVIYLHWLCGPESVYTFLKAMEALGARDGDACHAAARFTQIVGNYMGGHLWMGLYGAGPRETWTEDWSHTDSGLYVVGPLSPYVVQRYLSGKSFTDQEREAEREAADAHKYNRDGALLEDIMAANKAFFEIDQYPGYKAVAKRIKR